MRERVTKGFLPQPCFEPHGHGPLGIHLRKWLVKDLPARFAPEAAGVDRKSDPFSVEGEVADPVLPASEPDQGSGTAMDAAFGRGDGLGLDVIVPIDILHLEDTIGEEFKKLGPLPIRFDLQLS